MEPETTIPGHKPPDNYKIFAALCWARARLWQCGEFDLHQAVDKLEWHARDLKLDADRAQSIMAHYFAEVTDGWRP